MPLAQPKPTKGRAAGDDPFYTFIASCALCPTTEPLASEHKTEAHPDIHLPSVTSIIKAVFSPVFQPAAYWGAKQALRYVAEAGYSELQRDVEMNYEAFKLSEYAPNAARDRGASRGTAAHDRLEQWAKDTIKSSQDIPAANGYEQAVDLWWTGQREDYTPELVEEVVFWVPDEWRWDWKSDVVYRLRGRPEVGFEWNPKYAAHLEKFGYAGTTDLFRRHRDGMIDGLDLKTHKPPVRFEDHLQVAAYGKAAIRMGLISEKNWKSNTIVLAKENGKYVEEERWVDPKVFSQVRSVYQAMQKEDE